jgi:hypothetical protein
MLKSTIATDLKMEVITPKQFARVDGDTQC